MRDKLIFLFFFNYLETVLSMAMLQTISAQESRTKIIKAAGLKLFLVNQFLKKKIFECIFLNSFVNK